MTHLWQVLILIGGHVKPFRNALIEVFWWAFLNSVVTVLVQEMLPCSDILCCIISVVTLVKQSHNSLHNMRYQSLWWSPTMVKVLKTKVVINLYVPFRHIHNNIHYIPGYTSVTPPPSVLIQNMPSCIDFIVALHVHFKVTCVVIIKVMLHTKLHQINEKVTMFECVRHCWNKVSTTVLMHKFTNCMTGHIQQMVIKI